MIGIRAPMTARTAADRGLIVCDGDCTISADTEIVMHREHPDRKIKLGDGVIINPRCTLYGGVQIGKGTVISRNVILEEDCVIGKHSFIGNHVAFRPGTVIGNHSAVGHGVVCEGETTIGDYSLVHSQCHLTKGLKIGDKVFFGPGVITANDPVMVHQRAGAANFVPEAATIAKGARIGSNSLILPRVKLGRNATIGGGAVVYANVGDNRIVFGVPAKDKGEVPKEDRL